MILFDEEVDNNQEEPISEERFEDDELQTEDNYEDEEYLVVSYKDILAVLD